jgi:hypothetical protein
VESKPILNLLQISAEHGGAKRTGFLDIDRAHSGVGGAKLDKNCARGSQTDRNAEKQENIYETYLLSERRTQQRDAAREMTIFQKKENSSLSH